MNDPDNLNSVNIFDKLGPKNVVGLIVAVVSGLICFFAADRLVGGPLNAPLTITVFASAAMGWALRYFRFFGRGFANTSEMIFCLVLASLSLVSIFLQKISFFAWCLVVIASGFYGYLVVAILIAIFRRGKAL